jgi:basic amino acid/polyamine antiporter, APA family
LSVDHEGERLPRVVGVGGATAMVIGTMIGSGIFSVPQAVATDLKASEAAILCWIVGGLITLCGALSVAELAAALPSSGGPFVYLLEAYGPLPAFLLGWTGLTVITGAGLGALAMIFADYLGLFVPLSPRGMHQVAALLILLVGAMNYLGMHRAAAVMSWTTAAKLVVLIALGVLAFGAGHGRPGYSSVQDLAGVSASSFGAALIPIMWTYDGWQDLTFVGGEVARPQRTLPLALGLGIGCVLVVYLLVNLGFYHLMSPAQIARSPQVAAAAATHIPALAGRGAAVIAGIVLLSTFTALNGSMMAGPRVLYAMADRGLLFAAVGRVSPRFRTPSVAIWLATGLGCAYVLQNDFVHLANRFVLGGWPFFILTVAAVFVLRRTRPDLPRPYRTWGYPLTPAVFLLASVSVLGYLLATNLRESLLDFALVLCGMPVYYLRRGLAGQPLSLTASGRRPPG